MKNILIITLLVIVSNAICLAIALFHKEIYDFLGAKADVTNGVMLFQALVWLLIGITCPFFRKD
jgi:hypothetical protein